MVSPYLRKYQNTHENSRGTWPRTVVCLRWLTVNLLWLYLSDKWPPDLLVNVKWLTEVGVAIKCKRGMVSFYLILCDYIVVLFPWMSFGTFELLYKTQKRGLYISFSSWALQLQKTFVLCLLPTMCMGTVCVEAERKNAKLNNRTWLNRLLTIREYQNFLPYYNIKKVLKC